MKDQKYVYSASSGVSANFCFMFAKQCYILPHSIGEATNVLCLEICDQRL